jgi:protein involved in polysaccharide export with SLBB domain
MKQKTAQILLFLSMYWPLLLVGQVAVDPSISIYQLTERDLISFTVLNEPETATEQRIDGNGRIRVPYLGPMRVAGMTVRGAEEAIEEAYLTHEIYIRPQVTIRVVEYSIKEASILGQVTRPGTITFSIESNGIDIRDAVSQAGGFTNIARSREVLVTRIEGQREVVYRVNVDRMLSDQRNERETAFMILPGDVVFVPERFF